VKCIDQFEIWRAQRTALQCRLHSIIKLHDMRACFVPISQHYRERLFDGFTIKSELLFLRANITCWFRVGPVGGRVGATRIYSSIYIYRLLFGLEIKASKNKKAVRRVSLSMQGRADILGMMSAPSAQSALMGSGFAFPSWIFPSRAAGCASTPQDGWGGAPLD